MRSDLSEATPLTPSSWPQSRSSLLPVIPSLPSPSSGHLCSRAETRGQSCHLACPQPGICQMSNSNFCHSVHVCADDPQVTTSSNSGVTNKFSQIGEFASTELTWHWRRPAGSYGKSTCSFLSSHRAAFRSRCAVSQPRRLHDREVHIHGALRTVPVSFTVKLIKGVTLPVSAAELNSFLLTGEKLTNSVGVAGALVGLIQNGRWAPLSPKSNCAQPEGPLPVIYSSTCTPGAHLLDTYSRIQSIVCLKIHRFLYNALTRFIAES